ncbi:hypothetical protein GVN21_20350, partial [Caulobacter sp. SLTY]|uniref:hypothetical protein n=1 Tax=Caulobacter sp. SLTY TaxID=2683262 RepID=UPI0014121FC7
LAQAPDPAPAAAPAPSAPKNTVVQITIAEQIGSNTNKVGDKFAIVLAEPVMVNGQVIIPAGTKGVGEIVHVAPSGLGGRSGELLLAARYLELGDVRIPLKAFQFAARGRDTTAGSLWALGLVKGGQVIVPPGTGGTAKLAQDFTPPAQPVSSAP